MTTAVYPNGILPWSNKVDKITTVDANDVNILAAEVGAIETILGTNPQIEYGPPTGSAITYASVSARLHDIQYGNQLPVSSLSAGSFKVKNDGGTHLNGYTAVFDPMKHFNGTDLTVQASGWYVVTAHQTWAWASSGFHYLMLTAGSGTLLADDYFSWDFPENKSNGSWKSQAKQLNIFWQGVLQAGQRVSVSSRNASSVSYAQVTSSTLKISFHRAVPTTARG